MMIKKILMQMVVIIRRRTQISWTNEEVHKQQTTHQVSKTEMQAEINRNYFPLISDK
jgi:hypothetical protein